MKNEQTAADRHSRRFGVIALVIAGAELGARLIGADPGRNDPMLVIGLIALTGAAVMLLRNDERGRTAWIMAGVVMLLYAVGRVLIFGRVFQTTALAALGIMLALGAEQTLRPVDGTRRSPRGARMARSALFDVLLIPLAIYALFPFGVSTSAQRALATASRTEGYPIPVASVLDRMSGDQDVAYMKIPNGCTVSAKRSGRFWHPGTITCAGGG